jgi:glycosyltransferase involved in cell wall biosynthesis/2-polyprenyl-3-methyl-5-hydroxy-6-metoxy-1,4-benzoquinol methylase
LCCVDGYNVWRCPNCCADFVEPVPDTDSLRSLYNSEQWFEGGQKGGYRSYDQQTQHVLPLFQEVLQDYEQTLSGRYILDVGCGYGTHLGIAAERGWKCFGVEVSRHALEVARSRYGERMFLVDRIESLIPHEFDLILLLDVIEHMSNPYDTFFELFSKGAIGPKTHVVITTPNARSNPAVSDPECWVYRHPPSHLVFYSAEALRKVLTILHFKDVKLAGIYPCDDLPCREYEDEVSSANKDLGRYTGLLCRASGSNFADFMHERYVPGTWSKLAEYEHVPRYLLAQQMASDSTVLDFGCGSGYGASLLASTAQCVLAVDIDNSALAWARNFHSSKNLEFQKCSDLADSLPDHSFDLITCFELIEHLSEADQKKVLENFSRLITPQGRLLISTPNPAVTINYGANPYHLRELAEDEFRALLSASFRHVSMYRQYIQPSVTLEPEKPPKALTGFRSAQLLNVKAEPSPAVAYLAICSNVPLATNEGDFFLDRSLDYISTAIRLERSLNEVRLDKWALMERCSSQELGVVAKEQTINALRQELEAKSRELDVKSQELDVKSQELNARSAELQAIKNSKWFRFRETLREQPVSLLKIGRLSYLAFAMSVPQTIRTKLRPFVGPFLIRAKASVTARRQRNSGIKPYKIRTIYPARPGRYRVLHAIANFMTGGSSRLVVDLIERMGRDYEQEVLTSFVPNPPAYLGVSIHEVRSSTDLTSMQRVVSQFSPEIVHIHYWGECDRDWYRQVFIAAQQLGCKIIENVNTPVEPYVAESVDQYIYVSDFVRHTFGGNAAEGITIYPGSDLQMFRRSQLPNLGHKYVGMVYRLEPDKLTEKSVDVFIDVIKHRPKAKILIVGGGSLLDTYKEKVRSAGLSSNFKFTGYISYEDLPRVYQKIAVFVAPVWKESFGHVSVLAMNMGIPVVGYRVGALAEIIGNDDLLAAAGDSEKLAQIIIDLLEKPQKRLTIGLAQQARARELFSVDRMIANYQEIYQKALRSQ